MKELQIKERLLELVKGTLRDKIAGFTKAMNDAQHDANQHKGAMESRYDTFKEEAQALRDGFALQVQRTSETLVAIEQITLKTSSLVELGAIVATDHDAYFISTGLIDDPLEVEGVRYECVSPHAPIVQKLRKAGKNTLIQVGDRHVKIVNIF